MYRCKICNMATVFICGLLIAVIKVEYSRGSKESISKDTNHDYERLQYAFLPFRDFFGHKIHHLHDLWSDDTEQLQQKVGKTVTFLQTVKEHQFEIINNAISNGNTRLQEAMKNLEFYLQEAMLFQEALLKQTVREVKSFTSQGDELTPNAPREMSPDIASEWQTKTTGWWETGLESLAEFAHGLVTSSAQILPFYRHVFTLGSFAVTIGCALVLASCFSFFYFQTDFVGFNKLYQKQQMYDQAHVQAETIHQGGPAQSGQEAVKHRLKID